MTDPDALAKLDLFQIIREGKIGLVAANLALAAYQRRLAEQLGVEPGAELKAAAVGAAERETAAAADRPRRRHHAASAPASRPGLLGPQSS